MPEEPITFPWILLVILIIALIKLYYRCLSVFCPTDHELLAMRHGISSPFCFWYLVWCLAWVSTPYMLLFIVVRGKITFSLWNHSTLSSVLTTGLNPKAILDFPLYFSIYWNTHCLVHALILHSCTTPFALLRFSLKLDSKLLTPEWLQAEHSNCS